MSNTEELIIDADFEVPPILRARFKGATVVYKKTDGSRIIGDVFEVARFEGMDDMEILSAVVGGGDLDDGYIYLI